MLISKNYKIFLAGSSGMVGSAIKRALIKKGYKNLLCPRRKDLNLLNFLEVSNWFKENKPDVVILAAAKVGGIYANSTFPADFILENLKIQNNVIENAWKYKVKRFLFLGSSCIYPRLARQPLKEEYLLTGSLENTNDGSGGGNGLLSGASGAQVTQGDINESKLLLFTDGGSGSAQDVAMVLYEEGSASEANFNTELTLASVLKSVDIATLTHDNFWG